MAPALLLMFSGLSLAQTSSIEGKVIGEDGQPLKDALVKIERQDIKGSYKVKTRKKGDYFHAGLPLGVYQVILEVDGKERDRVNGVRTRLGEPSPVNFNLQETKKRQEALQRAAEQGQLNEEQSAAYNEQGKRSKADEGGQSTLKRTRMNDAFNTGMDAMKAKQYDAAVASFLKASELDPKQHVVWGQLADAYVALATTKIGAEQQTILGQGLAAFQKAIEMKPDDPAYHNNYGLALTRAKKFDEAKAELTKAAEIDPPNGGKYFYNLGAVLTNIGQLDPAGEAFKKATEMDPNYADAQYSTAFSDVQAQLRGRKFVRGGHGERLRNISAQRMDLCERKGMIATMHSDQDE